MMEHRDNVSSCVCHGLRSRRVAKLMRQVEEVNCKAKWNERSTSLIAFHWWMELKKLWGTVSQVL